MIEIQLNLNKPVNYGQAIFVCGNLTNIGSWIPEKSLRLNWSSGHNWSGTLKIQKKELQTNRTLEYKYFIGKWQNPLTNQIQWQKGIINRQIQLNLLRNGQKINDQWNNRKIKIHLITKKVICQGQSTQYKFSIIGNCPELGNWKIRKVLKIQQNIDCKTIRKLSEKINKKQLIAFLKNQLVFEVYATSLSLPLDQEKFSYYFIRQENKLQIQRHPGRSFTFPYPQNYPHRLATIYSSQYIAIYDEQNFDRPTLSKITPKIYLGSYLKNQNDLKHLQKLGIQAIYSIQTEEDHQDHGISTFYLQLLCKQYGILFKTIQIQDRNQRDFVQKSMEAVTEIDELIKNGNTTYVYCTAGKYRSPQVVALYLTLKNGINVTEAVNFIKEKHPVARPNQRIIKNAVYHINQSKIDSTNFLSTIESIKN